MSVKTITAATKVKIVAQPLKTAGIALGAGFILSRIPVFSLLLVLIRILLGLVRPTLLLLGCAKAWDLYKKQGRSQIDQI